MRTNYKRFLSLVLAFALVFGLFPANVFATEAESIVQNDEPKTITGTITEDMTWNDGDVVAGATISGNVTITVKGTVTVTGTIRLNPDAISTVVFNGENDAKLIRGGGFTGQMFYAEGVSGKFHNMTFNGVTLDGGAVWTGEVDKTLNRGKINEGVKSTGSVLYLLYTNVVLNDSVLQNHDDSTGEKANAVFLRYYSTIVFNDSVVRNNNSPSGYYSGGVITVRQGGTAKTYNSEVYGNSGAQGGFFGVSSTGSFGGICEVYNSKFHHNFADAGALFDMQCNSNKGYLLIDGCEFYENASNRGLIYEHAYSRPVIIKDSYFHDNECAVWDCHTDPILELSGKIVIEEDPDYTKYLYETPLVLGAPLAEDASIAMSAASVAKLMSVGYIVSGNADYKVTESDLEKFALPEGYQYAVVDVNSDGIGDLIAAAVAEGETLTEVKLTLKDAYDASVSAEAIVYSTVSCLPVNPFAHEGFRFGGWIDAEGNAVAKQMFTKSTTLTVTWKAEAPVVKLSRENATLMATVTNSFENLSYSYQWYMDGVAIAGATASTYTMTDTNSHSYKCEVTASAPGCASATGSASGTSSAPATAKIGETGYASLAAAISNAVSGDVITLHADINESVTVKKDLTISGNGKNFTGKITISGNANVTIENVNFVKGEIVQNGTNTTATLKILGCSFTKGSYAVTTERIKTLIIEDCTVDGQSLLYAKLNTIDIQVRNVTIERGNYLAHIVHGSTAVFEDVTATNMTGYGIQTQNHGAKKITLKNCSIEAPKYYALAVRDDRTAEVDTFVFEGENRVSSVYMTDKASFVLNAGATLAAPEGINVITTGENKEVVYNDGVYTVADKVYLAQVNGVGYDSLVEAVAAANEMGTATIILNKDVILGQKLTITGNVTISGTGLSRTATAATITRADNYTGTLFTVNAGAVLTLDGGLVIDGANNYTFDAELYAADLANWNASVSKADSAKWFTPEAGAPVAIAYMITTNGGTVNLNDVTIQNNYAVSSGIVSVGANSTVTLSGAKINHVAGTQASGVVVNASGANINVIVNEGTVIDGNHVGGNHGIFKIYEGAVLTMNGGEVKNTTGWNSNGVVVGMWGAGKFVMNGGTICSNSSVYGASNGRNAAVYIHSNSVMEMNAGVICHNAGRSRGGIDSANNSTSLIINGGSVVNNISISEGTTPDIGGTTGTFMISGGTFTQDVTKWMAPNLGLAYDAETGTYGIVSHIFNLYFIDPATGKQAQDVGPLQGSNLANLIALGKLFYANYYEMELEVLANVKVNQTAVIDYPMTINLNGKTIMTSADKAADLMDAFTILADVTVTGAGKIDARSSKGYAFYIGSRDGKVGNLTIENGTFMGDTSVAQVTLGSLTINGGNFAVTPYNDSYEYTLNCIDSNYKNGTAKITVNGGVFYKFNPANNAAETASTNFLADGYVAEELTTDYFTVRKAVYVAEVNDAKFESLAAAVEAANDGDTIVMVADTSLNEAILINKVITLDLNGFTISNEADSSAAVMNVSGTLTLEDNSAEKTGKILRNSAATDCSAIAIAQGGKLILNSGSIVSNYKGIQVGGTNTYTFVEIHGGMIEGGTVALNLNKSTTSVSITGGKFVSPVNAIHASSQIIIDSFTISGGEFVGNLRDIAADKLTVTGGTFTVDPSAYTADGYCAALNSDNKYTVQQHNYVPAYTAPTFEADGFTTYTCEFCLDSYDVIDEGTMKTALAEINGVKYESVQEAVDASQEGDIVKVLVRHAVAQTIVINKNITLDLSASGARIDAAETLTNAPVVRILAEVTITGANGIIDGYKGINSYAIIVGSNDVAGTLHISEGMFRGVTSAISVTKGVAYISGGTFYTKHDGEGTDYGAAYMLNCMDANYKNGTAKIIVTGGLFDGFNPYNNAAEGEGTNFCADNHRTNLNGNWYSVVNAVASRTNETTGQVTYFNSLRSATTLNSGDMTLYTVKLLQDVEIDVNDNFYGIPVVCNGTNIVLDLNGKTVTADWSVYTYPAGETGLFVVANGGSLTITGNGTVINKDSGSVNVEAHIFHNMNGSKDRNNMLTVENGTFYQYDNTQILYSQGHAASNPVLDQHCYIKGGTFISLCENETMKNDFFNAIDGYKHYAEITGGTFSMNPKSGAQAWELTIPEGYCIGQNSEEYYTVQRHNYVSVYTEPTFEADGYTTYTCEFCSESYVIAEEGSMKDALAEVNGVKYETLDAAIEAAKAAGTSVTVLKTIVLTEDGTLDLQGVRLNAGPSIQNAPVIRVLANVTVTNGIIDGRGPVAGEGGINCYAFIVGNNETAGTLNIADGTYRGVTSAISITNGTVNISGGTFQTGHDNEGTDYGTTYLLNCMDAAYNNGSAKFNITGGKFVGFNPENNAAEGEGTNFLSGNYKASDYYGDNKWYVAEPNVLVGEDKYFSTIHAALDVIQPHETATIKLLNDITVTDSQRMFNEYSIVINAEHITLDLNGKCITFDYTGNNSTVYASFALYNGATLTVIDSSEEQTGTIYSKTPVNGDEGPRIIWVTSAGTATIEAGRFISEQEDTMFYTSNSNKDIPTCLYIKGGYFEHVNPTNGSNYRYFNKQNGFQKQIIEISGGVFKHNPTDSEVSIAEGFKFDQNEDGTWGLVLAAVKVIVTVDDMTYVEGNAVPTEFTYTTDVEVPALDITYTVDGDVINATVAEMDGYEFTVIPGKLTTQKALVRVYAANNAKVKYFADLDEAMAYAVEQRDYVPIYVLDHITISETIVVNDTNGGTMELQSIKLGGNTCKLTSTFDGPMFKVENASAFSIKNMIINAYGDAFYVTGGNLNLNSHSNGSQFIEVTSQTGNCVYVRGGNVNVNGAKLTALGEYPAIQGNGNFGGNVTITKWSIGNMLAEISAPNSDMAIYWPGEGKLTVEMGTIIGDTALYAKSGTIVINGGEFIGNGEQVDFQHSSNGAYATGDAVVIESCKDAAYEIPEVSINGGTFVSANAEAVAVYNCNESAVLKNFISGGTFSSEPAKALVADGYVAVENADGNWVIKEEVVITLDSLTIVGGNEFELTYSASQEIEGLVVDAFVVDYDGITAGSYNITATATEPSGVYGFTIVDGILKVKGAVASAKGVNYATLMDAVNAASGGGEIILLADIENQPIATRGDVTLDLNGHSYIQNAAKQFVLNVSGSKYYVNPHMATSDWKGMINVLNGSLTVKDSVGTGLVESTTGHIFCVAKNLTIEGGTYRVGTVAKDSSNAYIVVAKNQYTRGVEVNLDAGEFYTNDGRIAFHMGYAANYSSDKVRISENAWFSQSVQSWIDVKNQKTGSTFFESHAMNKAQDQRGYIVQVGIVTVDDVWFADWQLAKKAIEGHSEIVLYADIDNRQGVNGSDGKFSFGAANKTLTLDLNGHSFTTSWMGVDGHKTIHITDSAKGGLVKVTNFVGLYANGYLNVDSDIDFTALLQVNFQAYQNTGSTGCFLVDGVKVVGRGHFQQVDGIFGTTGGNVQIQNGIENITFKSGNYTLNQDTDLLENSSITINNGTTVNLNGNNLSAKNIIAYGNLIDTADGVGIVSTKNLWFNNHNNGGYLPLADANGYRLFALVLDNRGAKEVDNYKIKFGFTIRFNVPDAYLLLNQAIEDGLMSADVNWSKAGETGNYTYEFEANSVRNHLEKAYEQLLANGAVANAMTLIASDKNAPFVSGDNVNAFAKLSTANGVNIVSGTATYIKD